jgi:hypothetical protein
MTGQPVTNPDLWLGKPHPDTLLKFEEVLGTADLEQIQARQGDHARWMPPQHDPQSRSWGITEISQPAHRVG